MEWKIVLEMEERKMTYTSCWSRTGIIDRSRLWISAQLWPNPWTSSRRWANRFRSATLTCTDRSRQQSHISAVSLKSHKNCCQIPKSDILTMNDDHSFSCKLRALMVSETSILRVTVDFYRMNYLKWFLLKHVKTSHLLSFGSLHCRSLTLFFIL